MKRNRVATIDPGGAETPERTIRGAFAARGAERGGLSARRKLEAVLRILRGETIDMDEVSRELGVTAAALAEWREDCLGGSRASLKSGPAGDRDEEVRRPRTRIGGITMADELLLERSRIPEAGRSFAGRRPRR